MIFGLKILKIVCNDNPKISSTPKTVNIDNNHSLQIASYPGEEFQALKLEELSRKSMHSLLRRNL